jgi:hypothetical protein
MDDKLAATALCDNHPQCWSSLATEARAHRTAAHHASPPAAKEAEEAMRRLPTCKEEPATGLLHTLHPHHEGRRATTNGPSPPCRNLWRAAATP